MLHLCTVCAARRTAPGSAQRGHKPRQHCRTVPTRIRVLVPVLLRQLMGTAKSHLECQSGQDRSGNIQVEGQFGRPSITLCKSLSRSSCRPLYSPFPVGRGIPSSARQHSFHALGTERAGQPHAGTWARAVPLNLTHTPTLAPASADTDKLGCYRVENLEMLYFLFICLFICPSYGAESTGASGNPHIASSEHQYCFASSKRYFKIPLLGPFHRGDVPRAEAGISFSSFPEELRCAPRALRDAAGPGSPAAGSGEGRRREAGRGLSEGRRDTFRSLHSLFLSGNTSC